jgi:hypothetical protein
MRHTSSVNALTARNCAMQIAQRLTRGLLSGKTVQGGRFPVPVGDHRVQVLDDHGFTAVLEYLREVACSLLRSVVSGTKTSVWLDDSHRPSLEAHRGVRVCGHAIRNMVSVTWVTFLGSDARSTVG